MSLEEHFNRQPTNLGVDTYKSPAFQEIDPTPADFDFDYRSGTKQLMRSFRWHHVNLNQNIQFASVVTQSTYEQTKQNLIKILEGIYPSTAFDTYRNQKVPARIFFHFFDHLIPQPENRRMARKSIRQTELVAAEYPTLLLLSLGLSNKQIAERLGSRPFVIRNTVKEIMSKLDTQNRTEAAITALERQLIPHQFILQRKPLSTFTQVQKLPSRQYQILELVAQGKTTNQIAQEIYLSPKSVRNHQSKIHRNLQCQNRTDAATTFYIATHSDQFLES